MHLICVINIYPQHQCMYILYCSVQCACICITVYTAQAQDLLMTIFCTSAMTNEDFKLQHLLCDEAMWWRVLGPGSFCVHIKAHNKYIYIHCIRCLRAP